MGESGRRETEAKIVGARRVPQSLLSYDTNLPYLTYIIGKVGHDHNYYHY